VKILIKVSGSISAYKICDLVSKLKKENHEVKVAASPSSLNFVGSATWEGLSGESVFVDDFSPNRRMDHIYLNDWADLVVLAPATAQTLNSLSGGVGSNVLTTLFLARTVKTPYLIFPAMNPRMWESSAVQKSVENLSGQKNVKIFAPSEGQMACGHMGVGRLNEVDQILDQIYKSQNKKLRALITFGGTTEQIDGVRSIGNFSTGKTGIEIARVLKKDFEVTALGSAQALSHADSMWGTEKLSFQSSEDLSNLIFDKISSEHFDFIVHAAAVSDFIPKIESEGKISSEGDFEIKWSKAAKILEQIREVSKNKNVKILSFKLTHKQSDEVVAAKISKQLEGVSDYVVHNELTSIAETSHPHTIWKKNEKSPLKTGKTKLEMARAIAEIGRA